MSLVDSIQPLEEVKKEICNCRKCRIKRWKIRRLLGFLPTKPENKIVGRHEYIRLEDAKEGYPKYPEKGYEPSPLNDKLNELKFSGKKVLNYWRDQGGWTIKTMAQKIK